MNRVRHPERAVAMAARSLIGHAISIAADRATGNAETCAVHRDEVVDLALVLAREQMPDATEIPWPFLADIADEDHRASRLDLFHLICPRHGEHDRQASAVVTDARRAHEGAFTLDLHI